MGHEYFMTSCQFHPHITSGFLVQECFTQPLPTNIMGFVFFQRNEKATCNLLVKLTTG